MAKRPLAVGGEKRRRSKRLTIATEDTLDKVATENSTYRVATEDPPDKVVTEDAPNKVAIENSPYKVATEDSPDKVAIDEIFAAKLTEKLFGCRPSRVVKCGVHYLVEMRLQPQPRLASYLAHVEAAHPQAKAKHGFIWNRFKQFFTSSAGSAYRDIESMTNVQAFVEAFNAEPFFDVHEPIAPIPSTTSDPSAVLAIATHSQASGSLTNSSGSSGSSSNSSSSSLSAGAVLRMRTEYEENFAAFQGEAWMLPSGACVDDIVAQYVRTLSKESALHSFIIDLPSAILDLFPDPADKAALKEVLVKREGESFRLVNSEEEAYIRCYDKEPTKIKEMLSRGWQGASEPQEQLPENFRESIHMALHLIYVAYRSHRFRLPERASESFFLQTLWGFIGTLVQCDETLLFRPAEVHSQASSFRKNKDRRVEGSSRQAVGRKADGLILSATTLLELCVFEAACKDAGPNATKTLGDNSKLAKLMKDSFDAICGKSRTDVSLRLVVYGVQIAGPSVTFFSMRKRQGRLYQMARDGAVSFPAHWDCTTTITILTIIASVMALRKRVANMAKQVTEWTTVSFELLDTEHGAAVPTLTTPPGSPRRLAR
ncbi:hypothetical protein BGZ70_008397 [Mortierella alpina]|uniref:Uncharacterized protein n=1 Tax=Mortierella alpina TaxID=64518 RepID=A0A9P6JHG4_MORAP|nr:hypothetical protein BGZ70_008397 [Mortierella alpina]